MFGLVCCLFDVCFLLSVSVCLFVCFCFTFSFFSFLV